MLGRQCASCSLIGVIDSPPILIINKVQLSETNRGVRWGWGAELLQSQKSAHTVDQTFSDEGAFKTLNTKSKFEEQKKRDKTC